MWKDFNALTEARLEKLEDSVQTLRVAVILLALCNILKCVKDSNMFKR